MWLGCSVNTGATKTNDGRKRGQREQNNLLQKQNGERAVQTLTVTAAHIQKLTMTFLMNNSWLVNTILV